MSLVIVSGQSGGGPGDRDRMLDVAGKHFANTDIDRSQVVRVDVPGRGAGEEGEGTVRAELEPMIPLLQSGSLFGERQGLLVVDAQNLQASEAEVIAALLDGADLSSNEVVLVVAGAIPRGLSGVVKARGTTVKVARMWERDVPKWIKDQARDRGLTIETGAIEALVQRYGTDTGSIGQALDQLVEVGGPITAKAVRERFRNRPDEPAWHITDAIGKGDVGEALRRLADFLVHGHPLVYLATLESDLKRRSLASAAPDEATFRDWVGGGSERQLAMLWQRRGQIRESSLRRAQEALLRADRVMKTQPEDTHRVTLERLTVALCHWYR
jgi:DNA polymerase III delta subunit